MKHRLSVAVIGSFLLLTACNKNNEDIENKSSDVIYQITTTGHSSQLRSPNTGESAGTANRPQDITITWTGGYITTSEIKFEAKGDGDKVEFKSKTVQRIDLFDAIATIGSIAVVPGTYKKIEFKTKLEPSGVFAALELTGSFENNGVIIPIVLRFDAPIEFKFEKKTPTVIDPDTDFSALNVFALNLLTSGITLQMLNDAVLVNNTIIISATSNTALYDLIWDTFDGGVIKVEIKKN